MSNFSSVIRPAICSYVHCTSPVNRGIVPYVSVLSVPIKLLKDMLRISCNDVIEKLCFRLPLWKIIQEV